MAGWNHPAIPPVPDAMGDAPELPRLPRRRSTVDGALPGGVSLDDGRAVGGVGTGPVTYDSVDPLPGSVLVTTTLRTGLAPLLPRRSMGGDAPDDRAGRDVPHIQSAGFQRGGRARP